ncbi:protein FAM222A-like [Centroberyx affinis]|uniref:protein FAM222A-like n=1 Tax=Centroberyx affinis TaxID=166261 RepID=UPI003A5BF582
MLACIQRRQNQRLLCTPKILDVPPPPLLLPVPPSQPCTHKGEPASMTSRYPSPAELDAFAQKTANSPLSIKIFPSNIRVPQHKQLNKTVNGLDTTGQRYSPYSHPYSGGYQGLLAIVKASVVIKGVVKNSEGKRTKHAYTQTSVAPYNNSLNNGYTATRHGHKAYHISSCKPPDVPIETLCSSAMMASGDQSLAPQSELAGVQSLMRQMNRVPHSQALQLGGEAKASPSLQAVAAVAHSDSDFVLGVPPQSSLAFSGAVLPTQSADIAKAGYLDEGDYTMWQHKQQQHQIQQRQQQQHYQHGTLRMYGVCNNAQGHRGAEAGVSQSPETCLPLACSTQLSYRPHPPTVGSNGAGQERVSASPLNCPAMHGEFSVGQYFAPPWDSVLPTPDSDCYTSQELATGPSMGRPRDMGLSHPHPHPNRHHHHHLPRHQPQLHPPPHPQAYSTDQSLCCGLPSSSLCHASVLSSSLQSLECLISEIHPPCIKERMLGRGYEAMGMPRLLEHHQQTHIQLPVYR